MRHTRLRFGGVALRMLKTCAPRLLQLLLVRYAAQNENFVPVVGPHNGLGARSAPRRHCKTSRGLCRDIKGRALDWLFWCRLKALRGWLWLRRVLWEL